MKVFEIIGYGSEEHCIPVAEGVEFESQHFVFQLKTLGNPKIEICTSLDQAFDLIKAQIKFVKTLEIKYI